MRESRTYGSVGGPGGPDHRTEPAPVGRTPMDPSRLTESVPEHEGFAPQRGRLQLPERIFPRPAQIADGCIVDGGDRDRGEVA